MYVTGNIAYKKITIRELFLMQFQVTAELLIIDPCIRFTIQRRCCSYHFLQLSRIVVSQSRQRETRE